MMDWMWPGERESGRSPGSWPELLPGRRNLRSPEGECEAELWLGNEEASCNMLVWGPLESLKKAVKCLEHGTPIEIGTEHVNLGIISIYVGREGGPVTWPLNISWPLHTLSLIFCQIRELDGQAYRVLCAFPSLSLVHRHVCVSLVSPDEGLFRWISEVTWVGQEAVLKKEIMVRLYGISCPGRLLIPSITFVNIKINYHRMTQSMIFRVQASKLLPQLCLPLTTYLTSGKWHILSESKVFFLL